MVNYHLHIDSLFFFYLSPSATLQLWQEVVKNYVILDFSK